MLGCMPVREDYEVWAISYSSDSRPLVFLDLSLPQFQVEHCNEAESLVAGIEACAGKGEGEEDEVETLCKLAQVHLLHLTTENQLFIE